MSSATVELDKQFTTEAGDSHGTISVRVVVLKPEFQTRFSLTY